MINGLMMWSHVNSFVSLMGVKGKEFCNSEVPISENIAKLIHRGRCLDYFGRIARKSDNSREISKDKVIYQIGGLVYNTSRRRRGGWIVQSSLSPSLYFIYFTKSVTQALHLPVSQSTITFMTYMASYPLPPPPPEPAAEPHVSLVTGMAQ